MRYIALLRGINVGGKRKVDMRELRRAFEQAGMGNVSTYINSGNVIFESELSQAKVVELIDGAMAIAFEFVVPIIILNAHKLAAIAEALPDEWVNDAALKCDVMFLRDNVDNADILGRITIKPDVDSVKYVPGALLWIADRQHMSQSGMLKIVGTDLYKQMTVRNCNTLRALAALSQA